MSAARQIILNTSIVNKSQNMQFSSSPFFFLREGTFFLGWGGGGGRAGASEGRVISESEHQRGRAIPSFSAIQGEGHTFSRIFNGDFCDVIFHFSLTD